MWFVSNRYGFVWSRNQSSASRPTPPYQIQTLRFGVRGLEFGVWRRENNVMRAARKEKPLCERHGQEGCAHEQSCFLQISCVLRKTILFPLKQFRPRKQTSMLTLRALATIASSSAAQFQRTLFNFGEHCCSIRKKSSFLKRKLTLRALVTISSSSAPYACRTLTALYNTYYQPKTPILQNIIQFLPF